MSADEKKSSELPPLNKEQTPEKDGSSYDEKSGYVDEKHIPAEVDVIGHDIQALNVDIEDALAVAESMSADDVEEALRYIIDVHGNDPNFPTKALEAAQQYLYDETIKQDPVAYQKLYDEVKIEAAMIKSNSPYAEVRAVVSHTDDPNMPALTIRTWIIGIVYVAAGAFINQFFSIRQPGILVQANVAQMLAFPVGKAFEYWLPAWTFTLPFIGPVALNPGHFNQKEHMLITIMANVGFTTPYTKSIIWVQYAERFYNQPWAANFGYQVLISLSTNFIGYGLAGICRRFLVYPSVAIWPTNLATIALNRAFHSGVNPVVSGWKMSRMRFFLYAFGAMFVYFWFPNYLWTMLSTFNWMTWIAPENVLLAAVTGSVSGLGLNPIPTFDWNVLVYAGDPLVNPFFTTANYIVGMLATFPFIIGFWVNNVWNTGYLPINSNGVFDNTGKRYKVALAVDDNALFDLEAYKNYSPIYLSAGNSLLYGFFFAVYTATLTHTFLNNRKEMYNGFRNLVRRTPMAQLSKFDVHTRLMTAYPEVSEWWYLAVLVVSIGLGAAGVGAYPTSTTPAVVLYGVFLALIFCIPVGIIKSVTNVDITLNVFAELLGGLWFPGNASAMNFFKSYGYVTTAHTISFSQDLKLAHYMHIPPRATYWAQMAATFVSTFVCIGILNFQMNEIPEVCSPTQKNKFTCPGQNTFFTASVLWGTLGPARMFGKGAIYNPLVWGFPIGFVLPIPFFFMKKRFQVFKYFHLPVAIAGSLNWAPYNMSYTWPAVPVGYFFQVIIKRRHLGWWSKYNYVLSSAFAVAIALSGIIQFFAVQYKQYEVSWVGNNLPTEGCDGSGCPYITLAPGEHFGPGVGEFS